MKRMLLVNVNPRDWSLVESIQQQTRSVLLFPLKSENRLSCLGRHWQQSVCSAVWNGQAIKLKLPFSAFLLTRLKHLQRAQFFPAPSLVCVSSRWSLFSLQCFVGSPGKRRDHMGGRKKAKPNHCLRNCLLWAVQSPLLPSPLFRRVSQSEATPAATAGAPSIYTQGGKMSPGTLSISATPPRQINVRNRLNTEPSSTKGVTWRLLLGFCKHCQPPTWEAAAETRVRANQTFREVFFLHARQHFQQELINTPHFSSGGLKMLIQLTEYLRCN